MAAIIVPILTASVQVLASSYKDYLQSIICGSYFVACTHIIAKGSPSKS